MVAKTARTKTARRHVAERIISCRFVQLLVQGRFVIKNTSQQRFERARVEFRLLIGATSGDRSSTHVDFASSFILLLPHRTHRLDNGATHPLPRVVREVDVVQVECSGGGV